MFIFSLFWGGKMSELCCAKKLLVTLYTKEQTKSMKPHCILGSCSAQFLSIMGWERRKEREFQMKNNPAKKKKSHKDQKRRRQDAYATYNWLLVQNVSLQISLFPEFSSDHQSHLERNGGTQHDAGKWKSSISGHSFIMWRVTSILSNQQFLHVGWTDAISSSSYEKKPILCCHGFILSSKISSLHSLLCYIFFNQPRAKAVEATHLALHLPGFGDSWQVTTCHHHGPGGERQTNTVKGEKCCRNLTNSVNWTGVFPLCGLESVTYMTISFLVGLLEM